jgi:hypothetical protein
VEPLAAYVLRVRVGAIGDFERCQNKCSEALWALSDRPGLSGIVEWYIWLVFRCSRAVYRFLGFG